MTMKKIRSGIAGKAAVVFLMVAAGIGFYLFNAYAVVGNPMPMPFGVGMAVVLSGSMEPSIHVNDLLLVKEAEGVEIGTGDVVVYQEDGKLISHRVVECREDMLVTRGDANETADDPIVRDQVKGIVFARIPYAGVLVSAIRQPAVSILMLAAAVFLLERFYRLEKEEKGRELEELRQEIEKLKEEQGR